jgi:hypothetical protein
MEMQELRSYLMCSIRKEVLGKKFQEFLERKFLGYMGFAVLDNSLILMKPLKKTSWLL